MPRKPNYSNPPATPMNLWVRNALEASGLTQASLSDALTRSGIGNYDRSIVQKMTVGRRITMAEAQVIAEVTGYPLPDPDGDSSLPAAYSALDPAHKAVVQKLIDELLEIQKGAGREP